MIASIKRKLAELAPEIEFTSTRERDPFCKWDGNIPLAKGYHAYYVTVRARAIHKGEMCEAEAYIGGSYYRDTEPLGEVHGYLPQMLEEAVDELSRKVGSNPSLCGQALRARDWLKELMRQNWEEQQKGKVAL